MKNSFFTLFFIVFVCQIASAQYDKYVKFKQKGDTYYQQSNYNDAYDAYSTSFNLPEGEGDSYLSKKIEECSEMLDGIEAYENKEFKQCLPLFNKYKNINRDAQFYLGKMYLDGLGMAQDNTQAKKMLLKSANAGHLEAKSIYTQLYAVNTRAVQDYRAFKVKADIYYNEGKYMDAKKLYQKALEEKADANLDLKISSCEEMNAAVNAYIQGNHEFSRVTFEKYKNHRDAQYYTGLMYQNGLLVNKNLQQSKLFFEHALAQGHPEASSKLKEVQNEINIKNSSQYSDKYIEKADMLFGQSEYIKAKKEYEQAMTYQPPNKDYIGEQILACRDIPEGKKAYLKGDFSTSFRLLNPYTKNSMDAKYYVGRIYAYGEGGIPINSERAIELLEKVTSTWYATNVQEVLEYVRQEQSDINEFIRSQLNGGAQAFENQEYRKARLVYEDVLRIKPDISNKKSIEQNIKISKDLEQGLNAAKKGNAAKALQLLRKYQKSYPNIQYEIGLLYEKGGIGLKKNRAKARVCFEKAATKGSVLAEQKLETLNRMPVKPNTPSRIASVTNNNKYKIILERAELSYGQSDYYNAHKSFQKAFQLNPACDACQEKAIESESLDTWFKLFRQAKKDKDYTPIMEVFMRYPKNKDAQYHIGLMLLKGYGVKKNKNKAYEWLQKSADQGVGKSVVLLPKKMRKKYQ